jgi:polysaccharide export outer membrane protein
METLKDMKIFLVDDDIFTLNLNEQHLRNEGFTDITRFMNGTDCLNNLTAKPDVIFLDHNMDILNGFEVLKKIKRQSPNTYVVMLSAQETIKTAVDALKFGAFDYIIKGDNEQSKMTGALTRIAEIQEMLKKAKPSLFKIFTSIL